MKDKIKQVWSTKTGKLAIIAGASLAITSVGLIILARKNVKILNLEWQAIKEAFEGTTDFDWAFENFNEAMSKFKEIEALCIERGIGEVAIFGGANKVYTVMHL